MTRPRTQRRGIWRPTPRCIPCPGASPDRSPLSPFSHFAHLKPTLSAGKSIPPCDRFAVTIRSINGIALPQSDRKLTSKRPHNGPTRRTEAPSEETDPETSIVTENRSRCGHRAGTMRDTHSISPLRPGWTPVCGRKVTGA